MSVKVTVTGLEALHERWAAVKAVARQNIQAALDKSAEEMVSSAQAVCPVEHGELRDSIHAHPGRKPMSVVVVAGSDRPSKHGGTLHDEARMVEFGTVKMNAKPFFLTTYRLKKKRFKSRLQRAIGAAVKLQRADGG